MEDLILKELARELNWREKIIMRILKKYTYKIYGILGKKIINNIL